MCPHELLADPLTSLVAACRIVAAALGESIGDLQALAVAIEAPFEHKKS
jgi:hypothetical protein